MPSTAAQRWPKSIWFAVIAAAFAGWLFYVRSAHTEPPAGGVDVRAKAARMRITARREAPSGAAAATAPPAAGVVAAPPPSASIAPPAPAAAPASSAAGSDGSLLAPYEEPVAYAVTPPEGGVPVHKEGRFRSPFAHPKWGGVAQTKVGFLLANVRNFDMQKGTFDADFFVTFTSDKPMPPLDIILTNGKADLAEKMAETPTFRMYRFIGSFSSPLDLHDYPFDTQELVIELEDDDNGTDQMVLVPDKEHTNLDVGFNVPGWEIAFTQVRILNHYFPDRFEHDDLYYSRFKFSLGLRRFAASAVFTVFMPAIIIVLISVSGLWLPRDELEVRSNATTPMLAAAVLFHYSLIQSLPATGYLTRADKLMMGVYLCLLLHMALTWMWFIFEDPKWVPRIMKFGKWVGAPLTLAIMAGGILL